MNSKQQEQMSPATGIRAVPVTFPALAKYLQTYGFEEYLDEITYHILFSKYNDEKKSVIHWTTKQFHAWLCSLELFGENKETIQCRLKQEEIDGFAFLQLTDIEWTQQFHFSLNYFLLLKCIRDGWLFGWGDTIPVPVGVPPGVACGIVADLSRCSKELTKRLVQADHECTVTGKGLFYGQLVVLGYKEYHIEGTGFQPVGPSNETFVMMRRKIPNGISKQALNRVPATCTPFQIKCSAASNQVSEPPFSTHGNPLLFQFDSDPSFDCFQLGRLMKPHNDFVIKGPLHTDQIGQQCGPISRLSCRIYCERLAPFRSFIFASGFHSNKEMALNESIVKWFSPAVTSPKRKLESMDSTATPSELWNEFDAVTTYGIKLYKPETKTWVEVSVKGNVYSPRERNENIGTLLPLQTNELTDGCIIDLCGVALLFQKSPTMAWNRSIDPETVIAEINELRPQCPVLLHNIKFAYVNGRERALRARNRLEASGVGFLPVGPIHIPTSDYSDIEEEHRSFVFAACGHVHSYHPCLVGKICSLCRTMGPFVPIAFAFEPAIGNRRPTHVFNPCGHVSSRDVCEKWAKILFYDFSPNSDANQRPQCPFCSKALQQDSRMGGPFSRLILQTESGKSWEEDEENDEDANTLDNSNINNNNEMVCDNNSDDCDTMLCANEDQNHRFIIHNNNNNLNDGDHNMRNIHDTDNNVKFPNPERLKSSLAMTTTTTTTTAMVVREENKMPVGNNFPKYMPQLHR